jgi:GT2 family glycosyltransferase
MSRVSVHLVTWNSRKVLPDALSSLRTQSFRDFSVIIVDNASSDGTVDAARAAYPEATVLRNFNNLGFARAHNQAIEMARTRWAGEIKNGRADAERYVLVMNPDTILTQDFLKNLVAAVDGRPEIGSAGGKLLRVYARQNEDGDPHYSQTIDSTGLTIRRTRATGERGAGEPDGERFAKSTEVFGISGALALYRMEALDEAAEAGEVFDNDFFAYKEDADLSWRLRLLGWRAAYVPAAVAYHYRAVSGDERAGLIEMIRRRWRRSSFINRLSTRNHVWLLAKNDDWSNRLWHLPFIVVYEIGKFFAVAFTDPRTLAAYFEALGKLPLMWRKRGRVMARRKVPPAEIRKWFH